MTRVSPTQDGYQLQLADIESSDWHDQTTDNNGQSAYGQQNTTFSETGGNSESTLRRRRRRSFEPGSDNYAAYVEKRVFNKRHAWTPFLWERKRDKRLNGNLNPTRGWKGWKYRQKMRLNSIKVVMGENGGHQWKAFETF
ncbi:uncharacterized protein LOC132759266 [Ruditapes philippinarum]|uniref:uncharacterized protein LOC132759266 n=1 Tax=Ruditapes philippinarum TaxID=129788 RepID=UPI00295AEAB2|nr:uncharacterized protein LOC132759266 [Ruditapes philippinarum]